MPLRVRVGTSNISEFDIEKPEGGFCNVPENYIVHYLGDVTGIARFIEIENRLSGLVQTLHDEVTLKPKETKLLSAPFNKEGGVRVSVQVTRI